MHDEYTRLMNQQTFSSEAELLEKLQQHTPKKRLPTYQKVLILAVCLCLLIPTAVFAAETIFDLTSVKIYPGTDFEGNDAVIYDIDFGTVKELPLSDFPEKWQNLTEGVCLYHDSWAEAQEYLGIDLMENTVLAQEYTAAKAMRYGDLRWNDPPEHCCTVLRAYENQLYSFTARASYRKENHHIILSAEALVEHPNIPEEVKKVYSGIQYILEEEADAERFHTETYTAANGLIATIISESISESSTFYSAVFRANGIVYRLTVLDGGADEREILIDLLEGFTF